MFTILIMLLAVVDAWSIDSNQSTTLEPEPIQITKPSNVDAKFKFKNQFLIKIQYKMILTQFKICANDNSIFKIRTSTTKEFILKVWCALAYPLWHKQTCNWYLNMISYNLRWRSATRFT